MPRRRPFKKGSFAGHFDQLVTHFPQHFPAGHGPPKHKKSNGQPERTDVHRLLFERAREQERSREDCS